MSWSPRTEALFSRTAQNGSAISSSAMWFNQSFATLGLTPGIYTYTLPNDTVILNIGGAVPEPATWALTLLGFGAIGFAMRRKALVALPT